MSERPWRGLLAVAFSNPMFKAFTPILGVIFVSFFCFFSLLAAIWGTRRFEGGLERNRSFGGARRPRNPLKGSSSGGPKTDLANDMKSQFLRVYFGSLGGLLGDFWTYLGTLCCCLVASWPQGFQKGGPGRAKSCPDESKRVPGEAEREPRVPQENQKRAPESPKIASREPPRAPKESKTGQKSPRQTTREREREREKRVPQDPQAKEKHKRRARIKHHRFYKAFLISVLGISPCRCNRAKMGRTPPQTPCSASLRYVSDIPPPNAEKRCNWKKDSLLNLAICFTPS